MKTILQSAHGVMLQGKVKRNDQSFAVTFVRDAVAENNSLREIWLVWVNGDLVDLSDLCCIIDRAGTDILLGLACDLAVARWDGLLLKADFKVKDR